MAFSDVRDGRRLRCKMTCRVEPQANLRRRILHSHCRFHAPMAAARRAAPIFLMKQLTITPGRRRDAEISDVAVACLIRRGIAAFRYAHAHAKMPRSRRDIGITRICWAMMMATRDDASVTAGVS